MVLPSPHDLLACPRCPGAVEPWQEADQAALVCLTCPTTIPVLDDVVLFTETLSGLPDADALRMIAARYAPLDPEALDGTPWWDAYAAFHPWNEAVRGASPLLDRLGSTLKPGDAILDLGDRSGWSGHSLAARFPDQRVVSVGLGGALGVRGHRAWLQPAPAGFVRAFLDLDAPLPFRDGCFALLHGHDVLHDRDPARFLAEVARVAPGPWIFPHVHLSNRETPHPRSGVHRSGAFWREALSTAGRRGRVFPEDMLVAAARRREHIDLDADQPDAPWPNALALSLPPGWSEESTPPPKKQFWIFPSPLFRFDGVIAAPDPDALGGGAVDLLARHPPLADALQPTVLSPDERELLAWLDQPRPAADLLDCAARLEAAEIVALAPATPALARLQHFHATRAVLPTTETLRGLWEQAVHRNGARPFLTWEDGSVFTYAECDGIARSLVPLVTELPGPLALISGPRPEAAFLFWAAALSGRLLHVLPSTWTDTTLCTWIATHEITRAFVEGDRALGGTAIRLDDETLANLDLPATNHSPDPTPESDAVVLPSSGTLGPPKGIVLSHRALLGSARNIQETYQWTPEDRVAATGELATMSGLRNRLIAPVLAGACVLLGDALDASATVLSTTPAFLAARNRMLEGRLRMILSAGAPLAPALKEEIQTRTGAPIYDVYGLTETAGAAILGVPGRPSEGLGFARRCAIWLEGAEDALWIASANAATRTTDGQPIPTWLDTGDRATRCGDGSIRVLGRRARTWIHPEGWKVALDEVEATILALGAVSACVTGLGSALGAAVVGPDALPEALRAAVGEPAFPRRWLFLDALPCNASGKIDEAAVAARLQSEGRWLGS